MQRVASWEVRRLTLLRVGKFCCSLAWRWVWLPLLAGVILHLNRPRSKGNWEAGHGYYKIPWNTIEISEIQQI